MNIPRNAKIAVLCAYNGGNSGMYSVDLAAHDFFTRYGADFSMFCPQTQNLRSDSLFGKMKINPLRSIGDLDGFTHIVYWGDFQNSPFYGQHDFSTRERRFGLSVDKRAAFRKWMELFALTDGRPESVQRVVSVGNNFQNDLRLAPALRAQVLESFKKNFDVVLPRDPQSLYNLHMQYDDSFYDNSELGMDAAFLLPSASYADVAVTSRKYFSYFFGRSKIGNEREIVRALADQLGLKPVKLASWIPRDVGIVEKRFPAMLAKIRDSAFVLSDTYHCCINTMNIETPIIGLGIASPTQKGTLGDFKKGELFAMFGLRDMYLQLQSNIATEADLGSIVAKGQYILNNTSFAERRYSGMRTARIRFEKQIVEALA